MTRYRTLIVDDEPIARQHLRVYLEREDDIAIAGECRGGLEAVAAIRDMQPDLVFLDVQMPDLDGFGVLDRLTRDSATPPVPQTPVPQAPLLPAVIFVTAHDEYAVRAFRVEALDYLLKPFDSVRFQETLERARRRLQQVGLTTLTERLGNLVRHTAGRSRPLERLAIKKDGESVVVRTDAIDWIEAQANYVRLHCGTQTHLLRRSLTSLEETLDPFQFARIHRTAIVNADRIRRLIPWSHGDMKVTLIDGTLLNLSRRYRERLERIVTGVG